MVIQFNLENSLDDGTSVSQSFFFSFNIYIYYTLLNSTRKNTYLLERLETLISGSGKEEQNTKFLRPRLLLWLCPYFCPS